MPGLRCPRCHATLGVHTRTSTPFDRCSTCRGIAVHLSNVRKFGPPARLRALWKELEEGLAGGTCPSCDKPMVASPLRGSPCPLTVETCHECRIFWFNADDLAAFSAQRNSLWHKVPGLAPPGAAPKEPPDETKVVLDLLDVVALAP